MKSKQLANVLIKVLGLSICARAVPSFISGILSVFLSMTAMRAEATLMRLLMTIIAVGVEFALGALLIFKSRQISDYLLKGEED